MFGGHMMVGGLESKTVTVKLQVPPPSSELEIIECVPTSKNDPDGGLLEIAPQLPSPAAAP
jgi:hypothetical protein